MESIKLALKGLATASEMTIDQAMKEFEVLNNRAKEIKRVAETEIKALHVEMADMVHEMAPFGEIIKNKYAQHAPLFERLLEIYEDQHRLDPQ